MKITIDKGILTALIACAYRRRKNDFRPSSMEAIHVVRKADGACYAEVTNGCAFARVGLTVEENAEPGELTIPLSLAKQAEKLGAKTSPIEYRNFGDSVQAACEGSTLQAPQSQDEFPPVENLIPKKTWRGATVGLNPQLLLDCAKALDGRNSRTRVDSTPAIMLEIEFTPTGAPTGALMRVTLPNDSRKNTFALLAQYVVK